MTDGFGTAETMAGEPDGFERLWTPHRMVYIKGEEKPKSSDAGADCPFCRAPGREDEDSLVVARGENAYAVLNLYPYNPGHLMVVPYRHFADYTELTRDESAELVGFVQRAMTALRAVARPSGFNLGVNQGAAGGAGIAAHLHQHIVPRWALDSNFFPIIAGTKALPRLLGEVRTDIASAWPSH